MDDFTQTAEQDPQIQQPIDSQAQSLNAEGVPDQSQSQGQSQVVQVPMPVPVRSGHDSLFDGIRKVLSPAPEISYSIDPQSGQLTGTSVPRSKGDLARGILAGALTSLLTTDNSKREPTVTNGLQAGASNIMQRREALDQQKQAQAKEDFDREQRLKVGKMLAAEANLRLYGMAQQLGRLNKQQHDEAGDAFKDSLDNYAAQNAIVADNVSSADAADVQKYPIGDFIRIPKPGGAVPRLNSQGQPVFITPQGQITNDDSPQNSPLWDNRYVIVKRDAKTPLRRMSVEQTGENTTVHTPIPGQEGLQPWVLDAQRWGLGGPQFKTAVKMDGDVPAALALNLQTQVVGLNMLAHELENYDRSLKTTDPNASILVGADGKPVSARDYLKQQLENDPQLLNAVQQWQRTAAGGSSEPDIQILDKMSADPKTQASQANLIQLFGGADKLRAYKEARLARVAAGQEEAKIRGKRAAGPENENDAIAIINDPVSSPQQKESARGFLKDVLKQKSAEEDIKIRSTNATGRSQDGKWEPSSLPVMLVEGQIDPSQLTKRSKDYDAKLEAASRYSMEKYGKPFNIAKAQTDYKYANQKSTKDTLGLLLSLTGKDNATGTLLQLEQQFRALGNTPIPRLNAVKNWVSRNTGKPAVTNFASTLLGVSDEMGKILGGGVATDSSREEARETIDSAFSSAQGKGAIASIRNALVNRQNALVEGNRYLENDYGILPLVGQGPATGTVRIKASDGTMHDIPAANLEAAKKIDPKLQVIQ